MDLIYDISRLTTRVLNATPNGIDWIDTLLADHFLSRPGERTYSLVFGWRGPRLFRPNTLPNPVLDLNRLWGHEPPDGNAPTQTPDFAVSGSSRASVRGRRETGSAFRRGADYTRGIGRAIRTYGLARGLDPTRNAPAGSIYLNASHFPLDWPSHVAWLRMRRDVRPVFFIHDILPILHPQYFWRSEPARHARRLALLAELGAAAIVTSEIVAGELREAMAARGRFDLPIYRAAPPVKPVFLKPFEGCPKPFDSRYFVVCGTIEPRKNHLLLAAVWRRLVEKYGKATPKLVVIGKRGWHCEEIVAALKHPALDGIVVEASALDTRAYRALLAGACALLSPSFAEGFGLPLAESLAAGTPAIVSDIPSHREVGKGAPVYLGPENAIDWLDTIESFMETDAPARQATLERVMRHTPTSANAYLQDVMGFLQTLA